MFQTSTCHSCNDLHGAGLARSGCAGERDARSRSFSLPVLDLHRDGRLPSPPFPLCSKKGGGWKKTKRGLLAHESWSRTIYVKAKLAHTTFTSMAAWQQACQTSCKMHCYASLLHPAGCEPPPSAQSPKYGANRLFHTLHVCSLDLQDVQAAFFTFAAFNLALVELGLCFVSFSVLPVI